jgi:hypothetical protein
VVEMLKERSGPLGEAARALLNVPQARDGRTEGKEGGSSS